MNRSNFAKNLRREREKHGLTQEEVANAIFKSQSVYARYEKGEAEPPHQTLILICSLFSITDLRLFIEGDYCQAA